MRRACGLCFPWAYANLPDAANARLVHGVVRHPYDGRVYPHAWIERAGRVYDWQSVAQGLGPGARGWPHRKFYALWQPVDVVTYDYETAQKRPWLRHAPIE
jgi:hypothetical protein